MSNGQDKESADWVPIAVGLLAMGLGAGSLIGGAVVHHELCRQAIHAGVGEYNPQTGDFEFIKPEVPDVE
jgi:hypothetical protein